MNVHGVPLHGWCPQLFKKIGNHFGKVVEVRKMTEAKKELRKGSILIETPIFERICRSFRIKIWESLYSIHVMETNLVQRSNHEEYASLAGDPEESEKSEPDEVFSDEEEEESHGSESIINEEELQFIGEFNEEGWEGEKDLGILKKNFEIDNDLLRSKQNTGENIYVSLNDGIGGSIMEREGVFVGLDHIFGGPRRVDQELGQKELGVDCNKTFGPQEKQIWDRNGGLSAQQEKADLVSADDNT